MDDDKIMDLEGALERHKEVIRFFCHWLSVDELLSYSGTDPLRPRLTVAEMIVEAMQEPFPIPAKWDRIVEQLPALQ